MLQIVSTLQIWRTKLTFLKPTGYVMRQQV